VILGLFDADRAGEILGLPDDVRVVTMMPIGVPAKSGKMPPRKPLDEFVFEDRYGRSWAGGDA
jgi:nitroreductase